MFRKILVPTIFLTVVIVGALAMERVLRLVQLVTSNGLPAHQALGLVGCLLPHYLSLGMTAGFFVGTMIGIRKMHEQSELVVMRTFGVTMRRIQRPIFTFAIGLCIIMVILSGFVQPHARHLYRARVNALTSQNIFAGLRPGVFYEIGDNIVIRANQIDLESNTFEGFFMARQVSENSRILMTAETASRVENKSLNPGLVAEMLLSQGVVVDEREGEEGKVVASQMNFEEMEAVVSLEKEANPFGPRGRDERELTGPELLAGGIPGREINASLAEINTELHARIIKVLSLPVLGILAIPLALIGQGRGAQARGGVIGIVLFVVFEKLLGVGEAMAANGKISPWTGLWIPLGGLILLTVVLFRHYSGDSALGIFGSLRKFGRNSSSTRLGGNRATQ